ncbi:adenosylcobinamide amidohydrolase [Pukyongiella litopenaei]|uniref:Adenosylcobinamide amidohydrolase n=1 Tax=Pukyongiella litopenaei TaxID=2605946 RepID=A0A2S0MK94_9RHOB|nr:adenosylcobinamide amidohydrolase [Pukyongiella litopenaei]AVO36286.1 adenosylcobinamide amidohydrolase [Pukyongiella litopenaei]
MSARLVRPWLELDLGTPHRVLSWAVHRPGLVEARHILWREVRNADLPPGLDVTGWLADEVTARGRGDAVTMLTSRNLDRFEQAQARVDGVTAHCVATVGLSNAERIGTRVDRSGTDWGTINVALVLSQPLTDAALIETVSIVAQARTTAIIGTGLMLPTGCATGTGTDCIAVAAPAGDMPYAGLHTAAGEATGRAVLDAIGTAARVWMERDRRPAGAGPTRRG